jgi:phosphate transport system substrate-binding protein
MGLLLFRVVPGLRSRIPEAPLFAKADSTLAVAGTGIAPELVGMLVDAYRSDYPSVHVETRPGGTTQALEDLLNGQSDVAFLGRLPTAEEARVIRDRGDSVITYPVALGGVAVLAGVRSAWDALTVDDLRRILDGGPPSPGDPARLYAPDPNRGLWGAVVEQLRLSGKVPENLSWMAGEPEVVEAVAKDAGAIGLASTLDLPTDPAELEERGVRMVGIRAGNATAFFTANKQDVATGDYPLYHYLYVSCRPRCGALASGFITYLFSGRGQRLVSRSGHLPAREVPRLIQLVSHPIGASGR